METHPVPKNVLTVEFKLFGALTAKQFFKILLGCFGGLALFALIPNKLVSLPLAVIVVGIGVLSALVKDFEVRFMGIVKALLVSPRRVWRKQEKVPEVLSREAVSKGKARPQKSMTAKGMDSTDLSIDKLLDARITAKQQAVTKLLEKEQGGASEDDTEVDPQFTRVYDDVFGGRPRERVGSQVAQTAAPGLAQPKAGEGDVVRVGQYTTTVVNQVNNSAPRAKLTVTKEDIERLGADVQGKVAALNMRAEQYRIQLSMAKPEEREKVLTKLNETYAEMKQLVSPVHVSEGNLAEDKKERFIYGVVVDKADQPLGGATISLKDSKGNRMAVDATSGADGRFSMPIADFAGGEYIVHITHPEHKFYEFKVDLSETKLPGFKFRER